jgi:hypothetical protein
LHIIEGPMKRDDASATNSREDIADDIREGPFDPASNFRPMGTGVASLTTQVCSS